MKKSEKKTHMLNTESFQHVQKSGTRKKYLWHLQQRVNNLNTRYFYNSI